MGRIPPDPWSSPKTLIQPFCEYCHAPLLESNPERCLQCGASTSIPTPSSAQPAIQDDIPTNPGQLHTVPEYSRISESKLGAFILAAAILALTYLILSLHAVHK